MRVGKFSVVIPGGHERETGHVGLKNGAQYTIHLLSHVSERADVDLTIDGRPLGTYRLNGHGRLEIEGPPDDPERGRFTFYKTKTEAAAAAGEADVATADKGLVVCRFKPEYAPKLSTYYNRQYTNSGTDGYTFRSRSGPGGQSQGVPSFGTGDAAGGGTTPTDHEAVSRDVNVSANAVEAGITGLSGHTDQTWQTVANLDYDPSGETVINLRLVVWQDGPRPLPTKPTPRANRVPPPVG